MSRKQPTVRELLVVIVALGSAKNNSIPTVAKFDSDYGLKPRNCNIGLFILEDWETSEQVNKIHSIEFYLLRE